MRPEEYAANVISFGKARSLFMKRLDHGMTLFLARHYGAGTDPRTAR